MQFHSNFLYFLWKVILNHFLPLDYVENEDISIKVIYSYCKLEVPLVIMCIIHCEVSLNE